MRLSYKWILAKKDLSGNATYRELTRNRRVGQRERGLHESFSLVSPYSSVAKPRGGFPLINGKRIPYMGGSATQNLHCFSVGG
jgi:hypothetical protein